MRVAPCSSSRGRPRIIDNPHEGQWIAKEGAAQGLGASRFSVVGDSVAGNMTAAATLMAKERGDVRTHLPGVRSASFRKGSARFPMRRERPAARLGP